MTKTPENAQAGIVTSGQTQVIGIPSYLRCDIGIVTNSGASASTFEAYTRAGQSIGWTMAQNERLSLDGRVFSRVSLSMTGGGSGSGILWALVPPDTPVSVWGGAIGDVVGFGGSAQPVNVENFPSGFDVDNFPAKLIYPGTGAAPITGTWRGYAVASAAGVVSIEISGVRVTLGNATAAGQSFAFTLGIGATVTPALTNCSIGGGILEP